MYNKQDRGILDLVLSKGIERNEEQRKIWTNYKQGHHKVAEALFMFRKDVHVNCMVPIGKRAFMKGKLIHTNEVLASLGDGYFAKYSAEGAAALCDRRIKHAEEMLKNLSGENDMYETRMMAMENNLFEDCAGGEIVEHWNEEKIQEWKVKHREREREYHQKLAKLREEKKPAVETEEDLFWRLDQLELEEELADEYNRQSGFSEHFEEGLEEYSYESGSSSESEEENSAEAKQQNEKEEEKAKQLKDEEKEKHLNEEKEKHLKEEKEKRLKNEEMEKQLKNEEEKKQIEEEVKAAKVKKCVSFVKLDDVNKQKDEASSEKIEPSEEVSEEDILRIEFSHSENTAVTRSEGDSIETPADIYRIYSKPKSILKRSPNDIPPIRDPPPDYSTEEEEDEYEHIEKHSAYESVVKDIKERDTSKIVEILPEIVKEVRPVSKFKRDRQQKR